MYTAADNRFPPANTKRGKQARILAIIMLVQLSQRSATTLEAAQIAFYVGFACLLLAQGWLRLAI